MEYCSSAWNPLYKKDKKDSAEIYKDDIKNMESKSYEDRLRYLACGLSRREKINRI